MYIKNISKKCEHEYVLYDTNTHRRNHQLYFICKKCEAEKIIKINQIIKNLKSFELDSKKKKVIGKLENIKESSLTLYNKTYKGSYISLIKDYYKNRGVNLDEIDNYYNNFKNFDDCFDGVMTYKDNLLKYFFISSFIILISTIFYAFISKNNGSWAIGALINGLNAIIVSLKVVHAESM
jgi:hypothetical protein